MGQHPSMHMLLQEARPVGVEQPAPAQGISSWQQRALRPPEPALGCADKV